MMMRVQQIDNAHDRVGIVTHFPFAEVGKIAIIDFFHWGGDDFVITPALGWALHKAWRGEGVSIVRFKKIVTCQESAPFWEFNRPAAVVYLVDYL